MSSRLSGDKMNIGIDAKWYFEGPPSGKTVVRNLVNTIISTNRNHRLILFLDKKHRDSHIDCDSDRVSKAYVWSGNNLLSNVLLLPFLSLKYKVDVLVYQNFVSPIGTEKKIAYVHDVIFRSHPEYYTIYERLYFLPLKYLTKRATKVVTVSNSEKRRLITFDYASEDRIDVVFHGVDEGYMPRAMQPAHLLTEVKQKYSLPDDFLLYVGRLNSRKNVSNLLRACILLKRHSIPLVLVGSYDWKKEDLQALVSELSLTRRVIFTGQVSDGELKAIYSLSKILCFPSHEEAFGLPPLEAMASGIPVVVSNSSSLPEICGEAGSYVDANDPHDIALKIEGLLNDDVLYRKKANLGLARAQQFTWAKSAQELVRIIESIE